MAPRVGFEPTTDRLTADCSTTELLRIFLSDKNCSTLRCLPQYQTHPKDKKRS